jgi:hypothetical protein
MTSDLHGRRMSSPVRFTLASQLGDGLDGAWWPHSASIARELPDLIEVLREPLGQIIDIGLNWSPLEGVPDLDLLNRRGVAATPGRETRRFRVMTLTCSDTKANLLVIPCRTSTALAIMLLRQSADLPVMYAHQHTLAFETAGAIVAAARGQDAPTSATPVESSS